MAELTLWDFLSARGENVILRWVKDERLTTRDRAILNQKLDRLRQIDFLIWRLEQSYWQDPSRSSDTFTS